MRPLEPADLEGTDGQLYKGRVIRKVSPQIYYIILYNIKNNFY